ncbi:hypothetical protein B0H10DRAFT_2098314 [Mycena sp. CBHHK59/15]|nr:hypothetical protein B0H10DRAFT_2108441 [Mycena sp. CBHHK59/15]KAJ6582773.1 hypothetical protein B0H10DRAFT_2098314 [Mycena sp. CBHHK59/15]
MGDFDQTIGFMLMAIMIDVFMAGVLMSQFATYWNSKYEDPSWIKAFVAFLFVINMSQVVAVVYMAWSRTDTQFLPSTSRNFANPKVIAISLWPFAYTALTVAIIPLANQTLQTWRIYTFTRSKLLVGFLLTAVLTACGTGVAVAIQSWISSELAKLADLRPVAEANFALECALDLTISIILSYKFYQSKSGSRQVNSVLNHLIRGAVQSGVFTSIFALGALLSFHFSPGTYMITLFVFPIGRIYTHTIMDHFIGREELRSILSTRSTISAPHFNPSQSMGLVLVRRDDQSIEARDPTIWKQ